MATLRESTAFSDQKLTLTVTESLELQTSGMKHGRFMTGYLKPIQVVVTAPDRTYTIDIDSGITDSP